MCPNALRRKAKHSLMLGTSSEASARKVLGESNVTRWQRTMLYTRANFPSSASKQIRRLKPKQNKAKKGLAFTNGKKCSCTNRFSSLSKQNQKSSALKKNFEFSQNRAPASRYRSWTRYKRANSSHTPEGRRPREGVLRLSSFTHHSNFNR